MLQSAAAPLVEPHHRCAKRQVARTHWPAILVQRQSEALTLSADPRTGPAPTSEIEQSTPWQPSLDVAELWRMAFVGRRNCRNESNSSYLSTQAADIGFGAPSL